LKAQAFDYIRAQSVTEAIDLLKKAKDGGKLIAGGQSLVPALNFRLLAPEILVDIGFIPELSGITYKENTISIGALTRHAELQSSDLLREKAPLISQAVEHVAHTAIRNRGTIGGNLAHADPASELPACMIAIGARMIVAGSQGVRVIEATDFFKGIYETALEADEILTRIEITPDLVSTAWFSELSRRTGDYAMAGLATMAHASGTKIKAITPVYFGIGDEQPKFC
jgi:aerobic carbon-monoxide dehydrogenase medium subunit